MPTLSLVLSISVTTEGEVLIKVVAGLLTRLLKVTSGVCSWLALFTLADDNRWDFRFPTEDILQTKGEERLAVRGASTEAESRTIKDIR